MLYRFEQFELDTLAHELRRDGDTVPAEPQVFALLVLLVENRDRLVSRDEVVEKVWDGRAVSDAAISSRIKTLRRALGDDGRAQRLVRTVHGKGLRFVAPVTARAAEAAPAVAAPAEAAVEGEQPRPAGPSIAVLRFAHVGDPGPLADALPYELIAELACLRWIFVIARGSSFRFTSGETDPREVGRALGVSYCLSGSVEARGSRLTVAVELSDTREGGVVWAERYDGSSDEVHDFRARIARSIVVALELQVPAHEARRAQLAPPSSLDAWSAYHVGLQHMYRFNGRDNAAATAMFELALAKDPGFARAHAGLSFTRFQEAFLGYTASRDESSLLARRSAERAVELDPLDPFASFTMGRSFWLDGDLDGSLGWLDRATTLCPNYAQGIYARAWADTVSGRGEAAQKNVDLAMSLSPLDPLLYAMLGTRAFSHLARGQDAEGAEWAERAARAPGAHVLIALIAVVAHELAGNHERALAWTRNALQRAPGINQAAFLRSFPLAREEDRRRVAAAFARVGF
jgi:TolB-like protein/tetratricopeptide (TPR) repeat protein